MYKLLSMRITIHIDDDVQRISIVNEAETIGTSFITLSSFPFNCDYYASKDCDRVINFFKSLTTRLDYN